MPEVVPVPIADLLLDQKNARLTDEQPNQQAALLAIVAKDPDHFLKIAEDIVSNRLDPLSPLGVVATGDQRKHYRVLEGNRRVAALKALETPALASQALGVGNHLAQLQRLAAKYAEAPIGSAPSIVFDSEDDARRWIELRHTGANEGAGLVPWGADEKDRFLARHGKRSPAGQVIDFLRKHGLIEGTPGSTTKDRIFTNLTRLINTDDVRRRLGIEIRDGEVLTWFPVDEVVKGLAKVVDDLRHERIKVKDIYEAKDRVRYARRLKPADLPKLSKRFDAPRRLDDVQGPGLDVRSPRRRRRGGGKRARPEPTALIPPECQLNVTSPRINAIYNELATLSVDTFPNACSVALRVFLELSVDHLISAKRLMSATDQRNKSLGVRLKVATKHLEEKGKIPQQLRQALDKVAESKHAPAAAIITFNQFVHNEFSFPKVSELRTAWTELQPFMEALWA